MDKKLLALIGAAVLIVGVFLPIVSLPVVGSMNLLMPGGAVGDGVFVVGFAVIAGGLALMGKMRHVIWPALAALAFIVWKLLQIKGVLDTATATYGDQVGTVVAMNWLGWAVLLAGALLLVYAGATSWKSSPPAA
jgi:hypothetical protein